MRQAGVEPYVIGSGSPDEAREFAQLVGVEGVLPILSDPKLVSYRAAGLKRSLVATLSLRGIGNYIRAFKKWKQGRTMGDPWQLGGAYIVKPSGLVTYRFVGQHAGDHPDPQALVDEAKRAAT
jgi:hypothetical protein